MIAPSLGAIVRAHGAAYQAAHPTTAPQRKAMRAIAACRTPVLGGTRQQCARCGFEHIHWHSCRNRHCPRCQSVASHDWLEARQRELLPVPYFHVVFTVPEQLNVLAMHAPAAFYASLLRAAGHALIDVGRTKLHATLGALCVLHTWGTDAHAPPARPLRRAGRRARRGRRTLALRAQADVPAPRARARAAVPNAAHDLDH